MNYRWLGACWVLCLPIVVAAQSTVSVRASGYFVCKDAQGRTYTGDTMPPECSQREVREHNRDGTLLRVIEAPLTPEQRRRREEEAKRKADEQAAQIAARRRDMLLMQSYRDEQALEAARERALADSQTGLKVSAERLENAQKDLLAAQNDLRSFEQKNPGKKPPFLLQRRVDDLTQRIQQEKILIARREDEIGKINARFNADKLRWLELKAAMPAQ